MNEVLELDNALPAIWVCGQSTVLPLRGRSRNGQIVQSATLQIGEQVFSVQRARPRLDANLKAGEHPLCGWESEAIIYPGMAGGQVPIFTRNRDGTKRKVCELGRIDIVERPVLEQVQLHNSCEIAICMATYNPKISAFSHQIASIQAQTYPYWHCIIQDDGSEPTVLDAMRTICEDDSRFSFFSGATNRGFYHNFERCLYRVPDNVSYVALSDQDDVWLPDKLQTLIGHLGQSALVYSDMKIVDDQGQVLSDTYWTKRRNNHHDMETVFLANTITGAAALFRRQLLDLALPFPTRIGNAFHDHWLGLCAFTAGGVGYVERPLYDYYQHAGNVIGHCEVVQTAHQRAQTTPTKAQRNGIMAHMLRRLQGLEYGYHHEYRRLQLMAQTLLLRQPKMPEPCRKVVDSLADNSWRCVLFLLRSHLRVRQRGDTTGDAELRLVTWLLGHWLLVIFSWVVLTPYSLVQKCLCSKRK